MPIGNMDCSFKPRHEDDRVGMIVSFLLSVIDILTTMPVDVPTYNDRDSPCFLEAR